MRAALARVPWPVWVALIPAVLIGLNELRKGGRLRVDVIGAGPIAVLEQAVAPDDLRFALEVLPHEAPAETEARVGAALHVRRDLLVVGLDAGPVVRGEIDAATAKATLTRLSRKVRDTCKVGLIVGLFAPEDPGASGRQTLSEIDAWWRRTLCRRDRRLRCVSLDATGGRPDEMRRALVAAIVDAAAHVAELRAATQVRR